MRLKGKRDDLDLGVSLPMEAIKMPLKDQHESWLRTIGWNKVGAVAKYEHKLFSGDANCSTMTVENFNNRIQETELTSLSIF